ncbi:MAG: non-ribosomal peptide synthetase [Cyclobacteriaceae bacterium]
MRTIQELLSESFSLNKEKTVIESENETLSYSELAFQARSVYNLLSALDLPAGSTIGIYCEEFSMVVSSILGVLYHRCVFVPLDKSLPQARLETMIQQADIDYILHDSGKGIHPAFDNVSYRWISLHDSPKNNTEIAANYDSEDHVYVYFTSGSSGMPKAVVGKNKSLVQFIEWEINKFGLKGKRFSQFTNIGFDASLRDILLPIIAGGTICVSSKDILFSGDAMIDWVLKTKVNVIHCVPSVFKILRDGKVNNSLVDVLEYILMAGEKILPVDLELWYHNYGWQINLVNLYGLTETTLVKAFHLVEYEDMSKGFIPVAPMMGTVFCILDNDGKEVEKGDVGNIYIKSEFLASGYLTNRCTDTNTLNIDRFTSPYNTGDIGRELEDGRFEIIGRSDNQVKISGIRINLDEIRTHILKVQSVRDAYVTINKEHQNEPSIYAYVIGRQKPEVVQRYLASKLPSYMVPVFIRTIDELPLLANGKVAHKALPKPELNSHIVSFTENKTEETLISLASRVFGVSENKISVTDNIVEIGRQSLKLMMFLNLLKKEFAVNTSMQLLFEKKTFRNLSDYLITTSIYGTEKGSEGTIEISI